MIADFDFAKEHEFMVKECGEFVLIRPLPSKHEWQDDELCYRSLLCRKDGEVVSAGYPKFFNYSEHLSHTEIFNAAIRNGKEVLFPEKLDGSLIIRSVIDGKVYLRSRGSDTLQAGDDEGKGFNGNVVRRFIDEQYPHLMDSSFEPGVSLLFEYCGPDNQIVLRYEKQRLVFLGIMSLEDIEFLPFFYCKDLHPDVPELQTLPQWDEKAILSEVSEWQDKEGVVAYVNHTSGWILVKIKASRYLQLHAFKYQMAEGRLRQMLWQHGVDSEDSFENFMLEQGYDYELIEYARPMVKDYLVDMKIATDRYDKCWLMLGIDIVMLRERKAQIAGIRQLAAENNPGMSNDFTYWVNVLDDKRDLCIGVETLGTTYSQYRGEGYGFGKENKDE